MTSGSPLTLRKCESNSFFNSDHYMSWTLWRYFVRINHRWKSINDKLIIMKMNRCILFSFPIKNNKNRFRTDWVPSLFYHYNLWLFWHTQLYEVYALHTSTQLGSELNSVTMSSSLFNSDLLNYTHMYQLTQTACIQMIKW